MNTVDRCSYKCTNVNLTLKDGKKVKRDVRLNSLTKLLCLYADICCKHTHTLIHIMFNSRIIQGSILKSDRIDFPRPKLPLVLCQSLIL